MIDLLNSKYWNKRYLNNDFGWDIGKVSEPLKNYFNQLENKNLVILIPGAGNSYEAEYLHLRGFNNVYVCDFAAFPIQEFKKRCPSFNSSHLLNIDFFLLKNISFDLIIEQTFFCALNKPLRKKYFQKINNLLNQKGKLVGLLFNDYTNSKKPPFGGNKAIYLNYLKNNFQINTFETCYNSIESREGRELFINIQKK